jgi:hypothetical protein
MLDRPFLFETSACLPFTSYQKPNDDLMIPSIARGRIRDAFRAIKRRPITLSTA